MEMKNNKLIVVLGMHRSGTSAITRGLQVMGVRLGNRLIPPMEGNNPKGFFEDIDLNALNIEMLSAIYSDWCHLAAIDSIDVEILRKQGYFLFAIELLKQKVSAAPVFGFKDPRVAKLLPFWKEVIRHCQINVSYVLAVRNPLSVVKSLSKRDGIDAEQSYLLWLGHVITSLTGSAGDKRVIVDYDRLMLSPDRELMRIAKCTDLEIDPTELQSYKSDFLDQGLRNTVYDVNDLLSDAACPPLVREMYAVLLDVGSDKTQIEDPKFQKLIKHWKTKFEFLKTSLILADRLYTRYIAANQSVAERDGQIANLHQAVEERDGQIARLNKAVTECDGQIANLHQAVDERDGQIVNLNQSVAERDGQIARLNKAVTECDGQIANLHKAVDERDGQIVNLNQAVAKRDGQITNLKNEMVRRGEWALGLEQQLKDAQTKIIQITSSNSWKITLPLREIRRWTSTPKQQTKRYTISILSLAKRIYQSLPLSYQTKATHRNVIAKFFPKILLVSGGHSATIPVLSLQVMRQAVPEQRNVEHINKDTVALTGLTLTESLNTYGDALSYSNSFGVPKSYDVICFPIIEWDHRFQRPQQLMTEFARDGHRVFYLNLTFHDRSSTVEWQKVAERIFQVQLPGTTNLNRFFELLTHGVTSQCLAALEIFCAEAGIRDAICMVQLPFWTPLALELRKKYGWKVIFDCMDESQGLTMLNPEMKYEESRIVRKADLVLVSAKKLWDKHVGNASSCMLLPNAVDFNHFSSNANGNKLDKLPRPIIGYYGAIMEWFDAEMVIGAAKARPEWSFVLIGKVDTSSVEPLRSLPNVFFPGEQPYSQLPGYLHQFDVCLIPFKVTPITESTNPVKFYEYLSAGKPIVAVPMAELLPYPELFYPARNAKEVVTQVARALQEDNSALVNMRINWARHETWQARYESLATAVNYLYGLVSIVIVSYRNLEKLQACLESIIEKTHYPRYEVIVVDNGSSQDVVGYLAGIAQKHSHIHVIFNKENLGFAQANNIGLRAISKDSHYIILLNNDTVVTRGWMTGLTRWLNDMDVGLVGPVTCPSGSANEAAVPVDYKELTELESFARRYTTEHHGNAFDIPMLAMYCLAMRRNTYEEIGPLDEQFGVGMFEDDDYSLRARIKGYRVICAEDVFIHHFGRASFSQLNAREYKKLFEQNLRRFEAKWHIKWRLHSARLLQTKSVVEENIGVK
jgi:GT2 family glycosyltransferase